MNKTDKTREKLERLHLRYAEQLPHALSTIEDGWKKVLDAHWDKAPLEQLLQIIHRISGSSASYGYNKINTAARMTEIALNEILENPIGATNELQKRLERHLDLLRSAFAEDTQPAPPRTFERIENNLLRGARANQHLYLVEDDPYQAEEIAEQISYFGYSVSTFNCLEALIETVKRCPPRAILMDVIFPEGFTAGPEAIIRMQKEMNFLTPVIFISESSSLVSRLQAVRAGGEAYFTKPVDIGAIVDVLDQLTVENFREICRVLIVDDSLPQAQAIANQLQIFGMETCIINDPLDIIAPLEDFQPNIILMDAFLPQCTGPELAKVIRQMEKHVITPVIYLSSSEDREKQMDALIANSEDFISKSIEPERLKNLVQSRLDRFRQLRSQMVHDSLTGLYNHTNIKERLDHELARASRQHSELSFAMIDLDHFKQVNDAYGHGAGDRVLKSMARFLTQRLRKSDIIGRYGGEEFAIILPDTPQPAAVKLLDELRSGFARIHHRGGQTDFTVQMSAGVSSYPNCESPAALIEAADQALYQAKRQGRNQVAAASYTQKTQV